MTHWRGIADDVRRFHEAYIPEPNSGCWLWLKALDTGGYGTTTYNRTQYRAHRVSWIVHHGAIPDGAYVCHRCDNILCVNPDHLFLGTPLSNMQDKIAKGRAKWLKGEELPGAKLTEQDVVAIRDSTETGAVLARRYGVCQALISGVKHRTKWSHI